MVTLLLRQIVQMRYCTRQDLETAIKASAVNGYLKLDLTKIKRYAVIEILQTSGI